MKKFQNAGLLAVLLTLLLGAGGGRVVHAADEKARRDVNQVPSTLAVTTGTPQELRNLRATPEGFLLMVSTGTGAPITGTVTANQGAAAATAGAWPTKLTDGTDTADVTAASALKVDGSAVTQPISAASLPLPSGAATEATLATRAAEATAVAISTTATAIKARADLLATEATAASIDGKLNSLGQKAMSASVPVAIAVDQSSMPVAQFGTWNVGLSAGSNQVGTVSGSTVVVRNAAGADAVNVQDGGNVLSVDDAGGSLTVDGTVTANAGTGIFSTSGSTVHVKNENGGTLAVSDGAGSLTVDALNLDIRDLTFAADKADVGGSTIQVRNAAGETLAVSDGGSSLTVDGTVSLGAGSAQIGLVSGSTIVVRNSSGADAVNIQDGGNSLTVDAVDLDVRNLVFATDKVDASGSTLGANSGVDVGDVTVNNAAGASAVNVQDGGNSLTVDGTVTANAGSGVFSTSGSTVHVKNEAGSSLAVDDNGGALTVDSINLDVRDLSFSSDKADVGGSTVQVRNAAGETLAVADGGGSLTVDGTVTSAQGAAAAASGAWPTKLTDGTDTADVTAASALKVDGSAVTQPVSGTLTTTPGAWSTPVVSTGACGAAATSALGANASAKTSVFCNEGTDAVRIGPAGVTATVGLKVLGSSCVTLDGPVSAFQGALYCIRTTGSDQAFSTMQGQ